MSGLLLFLFRFLQGCSLIEFDVFWLSPVLPPWEASRHCLGKLKVVGTHARQVFFFRPFRVFRTPYVFLIPAPYPEAMLLDCLAVFAREALFGFLPRSTLRLILRCISSVLDGNRLDYSCSVPFSFKTQTFFIVCLPLSRKRAILDFSCAWSQSPFCYRNSKPSACRFPIPPPLLKTHPPLVRPFSGPSLWGSGVRPICIFSEAPNLLFSCPVRPPPRGRLPRANFPAN